MSLVWAVTLLVIADTTEPEPAAMPTQRVDSYDSADLRRLADAMEELADSRLTPVERQTVDSVGAALDDIATGRAVVEVEPDQPSSSASTMAPPPPTTTVPPTTTTRTPNGITAQDWADRFTTTTQPPTTTTATA